MLQSILLTILSIPLLVYPVNGQNTLTDKLWFERIKTEDGLSSSWVVAIAQDSLGYLWFGTQDGLVRYNGYEFITYRYHAEDSTSLDNNRVETLFVSSDGTLWIGTASGVNRYRQLSNDFKRFVYQSENSNEFAPGQVNDFVEDSLGYIWWATQAGGLVRFHPDSREAERQLADTTESVHLLNDQVRVLMFDHAGTLWIGTGEPTQSRDMAGGLVRYNPSTKEAGRFVHRAGDHRSLMDNRVGALLQDRAGRIWVGTGKAGLHQFDSKQESFIRFTYQANDPHGLHAPKPQSFSTWNLGEIVKILHEDRAGRIWIGTVNAGLNVYDPRTHVLNHFQQEIGNPYSLANNLVWSLCEDNQGRIWIGNFLAGLHKVDPASRKFQYLQHDPLSTNSLTNNDIVGLCASSKSPGVIWAATRFHGLNRVDLSTGRIQRFRHRSDQTNSLGNDGLWTVYQDQAGIVWVGTSDGLDRYDPSIQQFEHFRHDTHNPNSLSGNSIISMLKDNQGALWVGTWGTGLNRIDHSRQKVSRYNFANSGEEVSNIAFVNSHFIIHEDQNGNIWTASWRGGLYRYLPDTDEFLSYSALNNIGGNCLYEDEAGNFWIGTNDRGLILFSPSSGTILNNFEESDGLPSNMIISILPGEKESLWLSTNKGLCQFYMKSGEMISYDVNDGLPSNTFNYQGGAKTLDGYYFFGSDNGLVFFSDHLVENMNPPTPYITVLRTVDRDAIERSHTINLSDRQETIVFPYSQRDFTIEYLGLHYTNPSKNAYRYKLESYDPDWIYNGTQRTARYTNLDPGRYIFQLQAANSDGYWTTDTAYQAIIILPPWWRTPLACLLYFLMGGILLFVVYRILIDRERQRNAIQLKEAEATQLREVDRIKSRFFANISHEFRTPLTLIQGPIEDLLEGRIQSGIQDQYQLILRNVKRLQQLITQLLDLARMDHGQEKLKLSNKDLIPFLRMVVSSFESLAHNQGIEMTFFSEWESFQASFDQVKLEKICINLLSNAIKFTPQGGKVLFFIGSPDQEQPNSIKTDVLLKIKDTGIGIPPDQLPYIFDHFFQVDSTQSRKYEGSGIGLALVKQYVELHHGQISVNSQLNRGTTFSIILPLEQKELVQSAEPEKEKISMPPSLTVSKKQANQKKGPDIRSEIPTLLLVDDHDDMRTYIKQNLPNDYLLLEATNGVEGVVIAKNQIPDLIISDVMMPEMDGFELCQILRTDQHTSHIPIILLTARIEISDHLQGIKYGADAYLTKPFNWEELNLRITKLIEQREVLRKKFTNQGLLQPADLDITPLDKQFLNNLIEYIEAEISNEQISLIDLSLSVGMSRSQLHRKLKALTGESPGDFLRRFRLQRAAQLLKTSQLNVSEIGYQVGFRSHSHFSQAFQRYYKMSPSDYMKRSDT